MRLLPIISAILVSVFLFYLVFERGALLGFANQENAEISDETPQADTSPDVGNTETTPPVVTQEPSSTAQAAPLVSVVAMHSVAQPIENAVLLRGQTEAAREVEVRSEVNGLIISEPLRKGTYVKRGELLCEIEIGTRESALADANGIMLRAEASVPEAQARRAEAIARLAEAEINDTAAKRLAEGGYASDTRVASTSASLESALAGVQAANATVSAAKSGVKSAEARVIGAQRDIDRLKITAPFAGLLETDTAELGSLMQAGSLCGKVVLLNPIKLVGFVPETDVDRIEIGAMSGARLASGSEAVGRVSFLSRTADSATRTFRVEVLVPNEELKIRDGQTVEITVASEGSNAHLLPASSLTLNDEGALGIRAVTDGNIVKFLEVSVLRDEVKGIWVEGLPEEVNVITSGQEYVIDDVVVAVTYKEPS